MDPLFLAAEAQKLHGIFQNAFFVMLTAFISLAVVMEFLKLPLGDSPGFSSLLARALLATLFLIALPEIMNFVADATDSIAGEIGNLNNFHLVLSRLGEKLKELSFSWTSLKDVVTILLSFLSFFGLYITVYFAEAAFLFVWTLIYVFSPLVFALYVFPATAGATKSLFRSILEVSLWKITWACMAALLWSTALSNINQPSSHVSWLTSIVLNLMLMISVLMTPKVVRGIFSGFGDLASSTQGAVMAAAALTPSATLLKTKAGLSFAPQKAMSFARSQGARTGAAAWKSAKTAYRNVSRGAPPRSTTNMPPNSRPYSPIQPK
jgi:hypothetical protein